MSYTTPWSGDLEEGIYEVEMPSNVDVDGVIHNFGQWSDGGTNPLKTVNLTQDTFISATFDPQVIPPPPNMGYLQINAFLDETPVIADGSITETGEIFTTPATLELDVGTYTVNLSYQGVDVSYTVDVIDGQTVQLDGQMAPPKPKPVDPLMPRVRARLYPVLPGVFDRVDAIRLERQERSKTERVAISVRG